MSEETREVMYVVGAIGVFSLVMVLTFVLGGHL